MEKFKNSFQLESDQASSQFNHPFISPAPDRIAIIAEDPVPGKFADLFSNAPDRPGLARDYKDVFEGIAKSLSDAGFNSCILCNVFEVMEALADSAEKKGISSIVSTGYVYDSAEHSYGLLDMYENKSQPVGFKVMDEPLYNDWGDVLHFLNDSEARKTPPETWNDLTKGCRMMTTLFPDRLSFFTLAVPEISDKVGVNYPEAKPMLGSCTTYEEYLDVLQRLYKPGVWIYDFYPFLLDKQPAVNNPETGDITNGQNVKIRYRDFYSYLDIFSKHACKTGRPFFAYCMCEGHGQLSGNGFKWYQPVPTAGMLRFEAFSALAYGAQGIVYWQYGKGEYNDGQKLVFEEAPLSIEISDESTSGSSPDSNVPVDISRIKLKYHTELWNAVAQVNSEINKLSPIFLGCSVLKILHYHTADKTDEEFPVSSISGSSSEEYAGIRIMNLPGTSVLLSEIVNGTKKYLVVVSHYPFKSQRVSFILDSGRRYVIRMPEVDDSQVVVDSGKSDYQSRELIPGGYMIIESINLHP